MDIGECSKLHDVALKADYEKKSQRREYYFEFDVSFDFYHIDFIKDFIFANPYNDNCFVKPVDNRPSIHCKCTLQLLSLRYDNGPSQT